MIVVIKNFMRNKMVNLTALSVRHFLPDVEIYCCTFYKENYKLEYSEQPKLLPFIKEFREKTLYNSGIYVHDSIDDSKTSGYANPLNGVFFVEGYNRIFFKFKESSEKILILAEDHFFTTGATLKELLENDWDAAYAPAFSADRRLANGSILGIVPNKVKDLFPIPEIMYESIEPVLGREFLLKVSGNRVHRLSTRNWIDYCGDGMYTNSSEVIEGKLKEVGILK